MSRLSFVWLALVLLLACKSNAEKACANAAKFDTDAKEPDCVKNLEAEQKSDPAQYQKEVTCLMAATDENSLRSCASGRIKKEAATAQLSALQAQIDENSRKVADLQEQLAHAATPEQKAALEVQLAEAQKRAADLENMKTGHTGASRPSGAGAAGLPKCKCAGQGDPLCSEVPGQNCTP